MAAQLKKAQDAKKAADAASAGGSFMFGDVEVGPPLGPHVILNIVVAFFVPPLGHYLSRPGDFKSNSFLGVSAIWFVCIVFAFLGIDFLTDFVMGPLLFLNVIWTWIVCVIHEKNRPSPAEKKAAKDSGVVDLER